MTDLRNLPLAEKRARARLVEAAERERNHLAAVKAAQEAEPLSPTIFIGSRGYDRRAFNVGRIDKCQGYAVHQNPFLCPENREAWSKGYERA